MAKVFNVISQMDRQFNKTSAPVAAGTSASIAVGVPTYGTEAVTTSPWTGVVAVMTDGQGTTAQRFTGIAASTSTETASVAGSVDLITPLPGIVYSGFAKTSTTADTDAEINALFQKRVVFDLTTGDWTVDAAAADAAVNCVVIIGGNSTTATLNFVYKISGTYLNSAA